MCSGGCGKARAMSGQKTIGSPTRPVNRNGSHHTGPTPYGQPKIRQSYGAKSRGR